MRETNPNTTLFDKKTSGFCPEEQEKTTPPTQRWPMAAGRWSLRDARISLLSGMSDMIRRIQNAEGEERSKLSHDAYFILETVIANLGLSSADAQNLRLFQDALPDVTTLPALEGLSSNPSDNEYEICTGDKVLACGLWQLFHLLSARSGPSPRASPHRVMKTIRTFVDDFFKCEECRRHFLEHYEKSDFGRELITERDDENNNNHKNVQLWLWRFHNAVTTRTFFERWGQDVFEKHDNYQIDLTWPSSFDCALCRGDDDDHFIEENVLLYLRIFFFF